MLPGTMEADMIASVEETSPEMLLISIALLVVLALAGLITAYVAFPHRGEPIPHAEWLSDAMNRSNRAISDKLSELDDRVEARREPRHHR
jgi:hypothetical protein